MQQKEKSFISSLDLPFHCVWMARKKKKEKFCSATSMMHLQNLLYTPSKALMKNEKIVQEEKRKNLDEMKIQKNF